MTYILNIDEENCREIAIWRAVIYQMLVDLHDASKNPWKEDARRWFQNAGADFKRVCEWAHVHPDHVLRRYREVLENGPIHKKMCDAQKKAQTERWRNGKKKKLQDYQPDYHEGEFL